MYRYALLLKRMYGDKCFTQIVTPPIIAGRLRFLPQVLRKYLAYIDKYLLLSIWLLFNAHRYSLIHIADHSNSPYVFFCPRDRCIITCHDLLAVRAAFGDHELGCQTSSFGIWLQRSIMAGLKHARNLVFVSTNTFNDYQQLCGKLTKQRTAVICNPLNGVFLPGASYDSLKPEEASLVPRVPFLLMVGSSHPRKNRRTALESLALLSSESPYLLVFAGAPLSKEDGVMIRHHQLQHRVVSLVSPSHELLNVLYCKAHSLVFPSLSEGFGWPLIEAQACGCPVIASNVTCIPEVAGEGALYANPLDALSFSHHILSLEDSSFRGRLIASGFTNVARYDYDSISHAYLSFSAQIIDHV